MSYYSGSQLSIEFSPKSLPKALLVAISGMLLLLALYIYGLGPYLLPVYGLYVYWLYYCYQDFVRLGKTHSPRALICRQGIWELEFYGGEHKQGLNLVKYFISPAYMVLHFSGAPKAGSWLPRRAKHSIMIFPKQVGERGFRMLYRCLKFQSKALFPQAKSNSRYKAVSGSVLGV